MSIRLLNRDDYAGYYPLIKEFRDTTFTEAEFQTFMDTLPSNMRIYIFIESNKIIGTTTLIFEPKLIFNMCTFAHVEDVCVLKEYHGQGIGSKLLDYVVAEARDRGCMKITLVCNETVLPFYLKNQFEKRGVQCSRLLR